VPVFPTDLSTVLDLAHVANGGLAVACSDQHFGKKDNLLNPNRGINMGDGWETARSREKNHQDWVIVKLVRLSPSPPNSKKTSKYSLVFFNNQIY